MDIGIWFEDVTGASIIKQESYPLQSSFLVLLV